MSELNRCQILDALKRHAGENEQEVADRVGVSKKTISNWINKPDTFHDRGWLKVLNAYGVDAEGAKAIAESMPVLRKTAVQEEEEKRRAVELSVNTSTETAEFRDPTTRPPGAVKWWFNDPKYFYKGTATPPVSFNDNQKVYAAGHSLVLMCIDALQSIGKPTTKQAICDSYSWNAVARTAETAQHIKDERKDQAAMFFDTLLTAGDIVAEGEEFVLADHVYESVVHQLVGDVRFGFAACTGTQPIAEYLPFNDHYPLLEDFIGQPLPEKSQRTGIAMTDDEREAIWLRTSLPRVEPKKENTSDLI